MKYECEPSKNLENNIPDRRNSPFEIPGSQESRLPLGRWSRMQCLGPDATILWAAPNSQCNLVHPLLAPSFGPELTSLPHPTPTPTAKLILWSPIVPCLPSWGNPHCTHLPKEGLGLAYFQEPWRSVCTKQSEWGGEWKEVSNKTDSNWPMVHIVAHST